MGELVGGELEGPLTGEPFGWFRQWFEEAQARAVPEYNACTVATVSREGMPSARIVYLKEWDERGFVFYTNLRSQKGREALEQGVASMSFFWREFKRQVRVEGSVEEVSASQADAYFSTRSRDSQLGAWASHQSEILADRAELDARHAALAARYEGMEVPRPPHWSGLRIVPQRVEFWQSGDARLHDRFVFVREGLSWRVVRLNP